MATILLIGSDQTDRENLASKLRARGHVIFVAEGSRLQSSQRNNCVNSVEIAVCDVTDFNDDSKRQLRDIRQLRGRDGFPVLILCYSRVYRGPRFELDIERLGARFVYAD